MYSETRKGYKEYFSGHTILLLLTETSTPTASGLTTIFKKTNTFYLVLSVVWSMRTCLSIHLKSVALEKPFFPTTSKIFMSFWTTSTVVKETDGTHPLLYTRIWNVQPSQSLEI